MFGVAILEISCLGTFLGLGSQAFRALSSLVFILCLNNFVWVCSVRIFKENMRLLLCWSSKG